MIEIIKKYKDKLIFFSAIAILLGGLLPIIHGSISTRLADNSTPAPVVLVFSHWWNDYLGEETLLELKNEFEEIHENISLIFHDVTYEEMEEMLFHYEADFTADIFAFDMLWIPLLLRGDTLDVRLGRTVNESLFSFINLLYYNINLLSEAGFVMPPRNRTQFLQYARAIRNSHDNVWALGMALNNNRALFDDIFPWIWFSGAELFRGGTPNVNTRQVIDSLAFLESLFNEDLTAPNALYATNSDKLNDFISGRTAFMIAGEIYIRMIREEMGEDSFSISSLPVPDNYAGSSFYSSTAWSAGVNPASLNIEAAMLFVDFLFERKELLAERAGTISGSSIPRPDSDPHYSKVWDIAIAAEIAGDFFSIPIHNLEEIFMEEFNSLLAGEITPTQAAAAIQRAWASSM